MTLPPRVASKPDTSVPSWCARERIAVSHFVAHDSVARSPRERAAMLREIGVTKVVWDWRDEQVAALPSELDALAAHGVELAGLWTPVPVPSVEEPDYGRRFGAVPERLAAMVAEAASRGLTPDLWTQVAFGLPGRPQELAPDLHRTEVDRAAEHLAGLATLARHHGLCVVITNHGGWAGEPHTLLGIVKALEARGFSNVGIALRLQHAHHLIPDLDRHIAMLGDRLVAIMLSGADAGAELSGRLVLPFGAGSRDRWVTHAILDSGWQGQLLVHAVGRDDARDRLLDSLEGWEWSLDRYGHKPRPRPVARVIAPAWPPGAAWRGASAPEAASAPSRLTTPPSPLAVTPEPIAIAPEPRPADPATAAQFFAAITRPAAPGPAVPAPPSAPMPQLGMTRRERRALRDQHEATAKQAARARRDEQLAAPALPARIGHGDVRIVAPDPYTGALHALLLHLEDEGFTGAPRSFGWDDQGRHLVEYVPGMRADHPDAPEQALEPARIGRFLRAMHDALESFEPPADAKWFDGIPAPGGDLIVHHDIAPSNIVLRADGSLVAIDWDAAGPGTRLWDLAYAAHSFVPLYRQGADALGSARRLRLLVDGYGLTVAQREELVPLLAARSQRMYDYLDVMRTTGQSPWVELWQRGVGTVWRSDAQWIADHEGLWRDALLY